MDSDPVIYYKYKDNLTLEEELSIVIKEMDDEYQMELSEIYQNVTDFCLDAVYVMPEV